MNKRRYTSILISLVFLTIATVAKAAFLPQAKLEQVVIGIADFVPPAKIRFVLDHKYFLPEMTKFEWQAVKDYGESEEKVEYQLKFDNSIYKTYNNYYQFNFFDFAEGEHTITLRACDKVGNCSNWSEVQNLVIDKSLPIIEILDQKISIDIPQYLYLKINVTDNFDVKKVFVQSVTTQLEVNYFVKGLFYDVWTDGFGDKFWMIVLRPDDQNSAMLVAMDAAGNKSEHEISW